MQKLINVLAVLSFVGTAGIVGGGAYVYLNREALAESAREKVTEAVMDAVTGALPELVSGAMPELPDVLVGQFLVHLHLHRQVPLSPSNGDQTDRRGQY